MSLYFNSLKFKISGKHTHFIHITKYDIRILLSKHNMCCLVWWVIRGCQIMKQVSMMTKTIKIKRNDWMLADTCPQAANLCALFWVWVHKQPIIALYFELESASFQSLRFILSLRMSSSCKTLGPGYAWLKDNGQIIGTVRKSHWNADKQITHIKATRSFPH